MVSEENLFAIDIFRCSIEVPLINVAPLFARDEALTLRESALIE